MASYDPGDLQSTALDEHAEAAEPAESAEPPEPEGPPDPWYRNRLLLVAWATAVAILIVLIIYGLIQLSHGVEGGTSTTTPTTTTPTPPPSPSGTNCLDVTTEETSSLNAQVDPQDLDACGYPSPCQYPCTDTASTATGVPAGTELTNVSSISCGANQTIKDVNFVGSTSDISINGPNCTIEDSHIEGTDPNAGENGDQIIGSGQSGFTLLHDELSGTMSGTTCTDPYANGVQGEATIEYSYIHCVAEGVNYDINLSNDFIISDGPCEYYGSGGTGGTGCSSAPAHYEATYLNGGGRTAEVTYNHNTLINPNWQTSAVFGDDHYQPPLTNWTVENNLIGAASPTIEVGCMGDDESGIVITGNRFAFFSTNSPTASTGSIPDPEINSLATTWTGNFLDGNLDTIPESSVDTGC